MNKKFLFSAISLFVLVFASFASTGCVNNKYVATANGKADPKYDWSGAYMSPQEIEYFNKLGLNSFTVSLLLKQEPIKVKGLYLSVDTLQDPKKIDYFIDLANRTEINAYVIDIKDSTGTITFPLDDVPLAKQIGSYRKIYDPSKLIKKFHDNHIYVIGRIVCFDDSILAVSRPDQAVHNKDGSLYADGLGSHWLNPYNTKNWDYLVAIAKSARKYGFDEIQFDYVRYPTDQIANVELNRFGSSKKKAVIIRDFLEFAKQELPNIPVSADVFGIICESAGDSAGLGQDIEMIGENIDYISPMIYPSHYARGQIINDKVFLKPDLEPYEVVYQSLVKAKNRVSHIPEYKAKMRPYLQDFDATWLGKGNWQKYNEQQVREQIQAVYDAGYDEWIFWNAGNIYSEKAFN